jgi:hypothetical protein
VFMGLPGYLLCNRSSNLGTSLLSPDSRNLDGYYGASMGDSQCVKNWDPEPGILVFVEVDFRGDDFERIYCLKNWLLML